MKQKKQAAAAADDMEVSAYTRKDTVLVIVFSFLLLLAMTVQTGRVTMILTGIALVACLPVGKAAISALRRRLSVPVIGLLLFALIQGLAAIYSPFDTYAVAEYYKFLAAFALAAMLLVRCEKKHIPGLLWGISIVCALIALVCVDMGGSQAIFWLFVDVTDALGANFGRVIESSAGNRIYGIYNDANITGAILGMAMPVMLHLILQAKELWKKAAAAVMLGISAISFLTAMSRGAMACFALAVLCYLLFSARELRLKLFFLLLCTVVAVGVTGIPAMLKLNDGSAVTTVMAPLCGVLLFLLYWGVGERLAGKLAGHGVLLTGICGALAVAAAVLGVVALQAETPFVFSGDADILIRSAPLEVGEYALSGEFEGADTMTAYIYSRTKNEQLLDTLTLLYDGPVEGAAFQVTDEDVLVYFQIRGEDGNTVRRLTLSDGTTLMTGYRWIPESIASRLHEGLLQGRSFQQRLQYFRDALALMKMKPLLGHGLGGSEGMLTAVQPYYYESKYLHNHVLQFLVDTGLVGTLGFLTAMLGAAWLLFKGLKSEERALAAVLLACWVMMNTHSLMEINFSIRSFQCLAYVLLALMIVPFAKPLSDKVVKIGGWVLGGALWLYLLVFGGLLMSHRSVERNLAALNTSYADVYMGVMERSVEQDVFVREDARLSFVANAVALDDPSYEKTTQKYVAALRKSGTYPACSGLARYYYLPLGDWEALFACSREGIAQEASTVEAWNFQFDFYRQEVLPAMGEEQTDLFIQEVLATMAYYEQFREGRLEEIRFSEENLAFMDAVRMIDETEMPAPVAFAHLQGEIPS